MKKIIYLNILLITSIVTLTGNSVLTYVSAQENLIQPRGCADAIPFPVDERFINMTTPLSVTYEKSGGFMAPQVNERIEYDSANHQLVSTTGLTGVPEHKVLNSGQERCLLGLIEETAAEFFDANYPSVAPQPGPTQSLEIIFGNRSNTVTLTSLSENVPESIHMIIAEIRDLATRG